MRQSHEECCTLTIRSAWPVAPYGDKDGLGTLRTAKYSASRSLDATVATKASRERNTMSTEFAKRVLDNDGYNLANVSGTVNGSGQIAAIISWRGTTGLWTTLFTLDDDFLGFDLALAISSWNFLATIKTRLPTPYSGAISRILREFDYFQRLNDPCRLTEPPSPGRPRHTCQTFHEAFSDTMSLTGSETSGADSELSHGTSNSSLDLIRTPRWGTLSVDNCGIVAAGEHQTEHLEHSTASATPRAKSPSASSWSLGNSTRRTEHDAVTLQEALPEPGEMGAHRAGPWQWDNERKHYHLPQRSNNDETVWFDLVRFL